MKPFRPIVLIIILLILAAIACRIESVTPESTPKSPDAPSPIATQTALPAIPIIPGQANPDEPVYIVGEIPYTSPFFVSIMAEPYVMLEDQAGFVKRDREFQFPLAGQAIGAVEQNEENSLSFGLSLPAIPQGTYVDVDNDSEQDSGVQVFAVAFWSNTWGDPFIEKRDGTGWSNAYSSTVTDPDNKDEIMGGTLVVWAPDDKQDFPTGFGPDGLLFTSDDPTAPIPAGYNLVDLDQEPFNIYKQARPSLTLTEGTSAVKDYSNLSYSEAFEALFSKVSQEYPFSQEKKIDWQAIHDQFAQRFSDAQDTEEYFIALRDFLNQFPDDHVDLTNNPDIFYNVFYDEKGGSFGLVLAELSDGRVIVKEVIPGTPAEKAGIQVGAEILTWNDLPVGQAITETAPYFGPFSTAHKSRLDQVMFLTRMPENTNVKVSFRNPGATEAQEVSMVSVIEVDSLISALQGDSQDDALALPIEARVLDDSGLGYIKVSTFNVDIHLLAQLWEQYVQQMVDNEVPGLIIDLRSNGGGFGGLALDFSGYFFDEEINLFQSSSYNERTGVFEYGEKPARIEPAEIVYEGPIAVLVGPDCVSACEEFAYALQYGGRSIVVGHYPTAGAFGGVGSGQYDLPDGISVQFPTSRSETPSGELVIEGKGVIPDISVPITEESVLGQQDAVLDAAVEALLDKLK